jgi:6-phospho-beta-glucosidase
LKLLPTEYLYYYYRPEHALAKITASGSSRGQAVAALTDELFSNPTLENYQRYLARRDSSYMQLETGSAPRIKPDWAELSGYDRIALITIRAIVNNQGAIIPLDVANRGTFPFLDDEDIIEVPCRVDANGAQPQVVGPIPDHPRELITRVKEYERATIKAALTGDRNELAEALALNPLVHSNDVAKRLVAALL